MGLSSITLRLLLQYTRLQRQLWSKYTAPPQVMSYAAPAQVLMYLALAPAACAASIFTAIGPFGSLPVDPTVCTCTCGILHSVNNSSVRSTCTCHEVHRVAPAVYVTSAPVVESTRRLQHIRCTCACRGVHHVSTISVLRRASTGTVYFVPEPVSKATYCDCNRWLRFSPCRAHRLHLHLWWNTSRLYHRYTWHLSLSWTTSPQHHQCMLHLHLWWSQRAGIISERFTFAFCGAHRANTSNVLRGGVL